MGNVRQPAVSVILSFNVRRSARSCRRMPILSMQLPHVRIHQFGRTAKVTGTVHAWRTYRSRWAAHEHLWGDTMSPVTIFSNGRVRPVGVVFGPFVVPVPFVRGAHAFDGMAPAHDRQFECRTGSCGNLFISYRLLCCCLLERRGEFGMEASCVTLTGFQQPDIFSSVLRAG